MTATVDQVRQQAFSLNRDERAVLAQELFDSVESDEDTRAAWNAEIRRRVAASEDGTARSRPVAEFLAELRAEYP